MNTISRARILAATAGVAVAAGIGLGAADAATTATVKIRNIDFSPRTLTVKKGTTVTWRFLDGDTNTPHNVVSRGSTRFRSSATKQTGTHKVTFRKSGTYRYVCTIHPNMKGRVIVR